MTSKSSKNREEYIINHYVKPSQMSLSAQEGCAGPFLLALHDFKATSPRQSIFFCQDFVPC